MSSSRVANETSRALGEPATWRLIHAAKAGAKRFFAAGNQANLYFLQKVTAARQVTWPPSGLQEYLSFTE